MGFALLGVSVKAVRCLTHDVGRGRAGAAAADSAGGGRATRSAWRRPPRATALQFAPSIIADRCVCACQHIVSALRGMGSVMQLQHLQIEDASHIQPLAVTHANISIMTPLEGQDKT